MKRFIVLILAAALLLSVACGSESADTDTNDDSTYESVLSTDESTQRYYDTTGKSYGGYEFRIWNYDNEHDNGWNGIPDDIYAESENGDVLNDAVYKRNLVVSDKLGINIVFESKVGSDLSNQLIEMTMADDNEADLVFVNQASFPYIFQRGVLSNLLSADGFDFSEPWWDQNLIESFTLQDQLYGIVSDATYFDKLGTYVTFYNKKLADDYKLGDLYKIVKDDEWTLDKLLDLGKVMSADINADGIRDENDAYPLSCQNDACYILLHAAKIPIVSKTDEGSLTFNLTSERAVTALQTIYELMNDGTRFFNRQKYDYTLYDAISMFNAGKAMFLIRPIQSLFVMRSMDSDFGILPLPKLDEAQEDYASSINPYVSTMACVPVTVDDLERSAAVLSLMACESYYSVNPALYETVLGNKLIRDDDSAKMLDIVFDSALYDPGLLWNFGGILYKLLNNTSTDVASLLAGVNTQVEAAIGELNKTLSEKE